MGNREKLANHWKKDVWKSIDEQDVIQLRNKLNEILILTENELQSCGMNSFKGSESIEKSYM